MTPDDLETGALAWLGIHAESTGPDTDAAKAVAPAVVAFVDDLPDVHRYPLEDDPEAVPEWREHIKLAAVMLAARLVRRRNSPQGVAAFTEGGAAYVSRVDPDVAQMLKLGRYATPKVG